MWVGQLLEYNEQGIHTLARVVRKTEELANFALVKAYRSRFEATIKDPKGNLNADEKYVFETLVGHLTFGMVNDGGKFISPYYVMLLDMEESDITTITFEAAEDTPDYLSLD